MAELINLSDIIQNIVSSCIEQNTDIKASFDIENNVKVRGDRELIHIVIKNLIDNAIKYSSKKEKPLVIFGKVEGEDTFFVKDNGIGFNSTLASNYFSDLENTKETNNDRAQTGLIIVKQIIAKQGGKIWAVSQENIGTTIYFTLS